MHTLLSQANALVLHRLCPALSFFGLQLRFNCLKVSTWTNIGSTAFVCWAVVFTNVLVCTHRSSLTFDHRQFCVCATSVPVPEGSNSCSLQFIRLSLADLQIGKKHAQDRSGVRKWERRLTIHILLGQNKTTGFFFEKRRPNFICGHLRKQEATPRKRAAPRLWHCRTTDLTYCSCLT